MFIKYLVISSIKNSPVSNILEEHSIEFDFLHKEKFDNNFVIDNKVVIFEDIDIDTMYKYRQENFLARFIFVKSEESILNNDKIYLCQLSAILESPIDEKLLFEKIIKCDEEILKINNELFSKIDNSIQKNDSFKIDEKYSKNEIILLNMFINNENIVISDENILEYFSFFDISISIKTLKNLLSTIRKKNKALKIENIYGTGYKYKRDELPLEIKSLIDLEYERSILSSKSFDFSIDISCSYLLNKLDIDRVCFMEYENDIVKILNEKVIYPQKKVLEQINSLNITSFHKKTLFMCLKEEKPYIINFDEIVNLYFLFPKEFKGEAKAKSIVYFPFKYKNRLFSIGLHQNYSYRRWKSSEIELLKKVIVIIKKNRFF